MKKKSIQLAGIITLTSSLLITPTFAIEPNLQGATSASQSSINLPKLNRLIIKFKDDATEFTMLNAQADLKAQKIGILQQRLSQSFTFKRSMLNDKFHILESGSDADINVLKQELEASDLVESVELDGRVFAQGFSSGNSYPNDSKYNRLWSYHEDTAGINVENAWRQGISGAGATVAVIDTGWSEHEDLPNPISEYDFISYSIVARDGDGRDSNAKDEGDWIESNYACGYYTETSNSSWHGGHVAGTISALTDNSQGIAGIAYGSNLVVARVLGKCGGLFTDLADAIKWASGETVNGISNSNPAQVINLSLGGTSSCPSYLQDAIDTAYKNGVTIVTAAGNSNTDAVKTTPGNCNNVINVAAVSRQRNRAYYSNYGSNVTIAAPGGDYYEGYSSDDEILSTLNGGTTIPEEGNDIYDTYQGTSMAAPHVSAVAALLKEANPNITPDEIKTALTSTAASFGANSDCDTTICGAGLIDAGAAVSYVLDQVATEIEETVTIAENISGFALPFPFWNSNPSSKKLYTFTLPTNATSLTVYTTGGIGKINSMTLLQTSYDNPFGIPIPATLCISNNVNTTEQSCTIENPNSDKEFQVTLTVQNSLYFNVSLKYDYTYTAE